MSIIHSQNLDQSQNSDIIEDQNFENDDLVTFQHDLITINLYYSQFAKYSKYIRDSYLMSDVSNRFPQEIHKFQEEFHLSPESIDYFFQLLRQNYDVTEDIKLTYIQCTDLLKISEFLKVRKLKFKINEYIISQKVDVDFVIQMIQYELTTQKETEEQPFDISKEIEQLLTMKINDCLTNEKFKELPIQIIYRIVSKSSHEKINNNKLYDIIMSSISKFCVLFQFLDLQKLSEDRLEELCENYSKSDENSHQYFGYLKCNLNFIRKMNKKEKDLQKANDEMKVKMDEFETKIESIQKQFVSSEKVNDQLKSQLNSSKELIDGQQNKMNELERANIQLQNQLNLLKKQINKLTLIKGSISAKVEYGIFVSAEINLKEIESPLDTSRSKFIISSCGKKSIGIEAYEKGEQITSLHMKTSPFFLRPGTYFVRCIVFDSTGESNEIVSNSVTTSESCMSFNCERPQPVKISLPKGQYKLEVWGAKGGNSTGDVYGGRKSQSISGGLGGYSCGILNLNQTETVYVYVGGEGRTSDLADGSKTSGGFPDGGGTKTGHSDYSWNAKKNSVPGTGGGSTSIRIGSDTDYARVIVAGGGGGAGGCCNTEDPGGFGGGLSGGNCYYNGSLQSQGAGTQKGSTCGLGEGSDRNGDPGQFGLGAANKYKQGCDTGGGGGGGWYGGGSGGFGNYNVCSSGGGGSGWTFTESCFNEWKSGDPSKASKFILNSTYYLKDAKCIGGNEEFPTTDGNSTERGHSGNGFAKITPL